MHYKLTISERAESHIDNILDYVVNILKNPGAARNIIADIEEARAYLQEPTLRARLLEISDALLQLSSNDPTYVMGYPDDLKLRSSMTLFAEAEPECEVFQKVLDKYYGGIKDSRTLEILYR